MRYIRIFLVTFQHVFEYRGRIAVWFLTSLLNPLLLLLFWGGLTHGTKAIVAGWNGSVIISYYLFIALLDSILMCHIEEDISREDVQKGNLIGYLIKPISYYWKKFIEEIPYRIIQGLYALILVLGAILLVKNFTISSSFLIISIAIISAFLGLFLSFTIKMILGLLSLWLIEIEGMFQFYEILNFILGGYVVPLFLLPKYVAQIAYLLPFSYVVYFPLSIFQGRLSLSQVLLALAGQVSWLVVFAIMYKFLWGKGVRKFTGVGR